MMRRINFVVVALVALLLAVAGGAPASAAESLMVGPGYVTVSASDSPRALLTSARPGTTSYVGKYLQVAVQNATSSDELTFAPAQSSSITSQVVSVVNNVVYIGNGSTAVRVGTVDSTRSGGPGNALRVNMETSPSNADVGKIFTAVLYRYIGSAPNGAKAVNYTIGSGSNTLATATQIVSFSNVDMPATIADAEITLENNYGVDDPFGFVVGNFAGSDSDSGLLYASSSASSVTRSLVGGVYVNKKIVTALGELFFNSSTGEWAFIPNAEVINSQDTSTTATVNLALNRVPFTFTISTVMIGGGSNAGNGPADSPASDASPVAVASAGSKASKPGSSAAAKKPAQSDTATPTDSAPSAAAAAIGATGDDSVLVEFDPLGSPESIAALSGALVLAVSLAGGVTAATAGGGGGGNAGGAAPADAPAQNDSARTDGGAELEGLEATEDLITIERKSWGDKLGIFVLPAVTFLDKFSHDSAIKVARWSPMLSKLIIDGAYLRAILGSFSLMFTIVNVALACVSVAANNGDLLTPPWQIFAVMAVIGTFDAFAGFVAAVVFISGSFVFATDPGVIGDYRMMFGVLFVLMGPGLLMTAFRALRKDVEPGFNGLWERLSDFVIAPLMAGVAVTTAVTVLPALSGLTLPVANHIAVFGISVAVAAALRVLLEELATRGYPARLNSINPSSVPRAPWFQQAFALLVSYGFWVFLTGAISGDVWQIYVGSFLFLLPAILGKFCERFPNSVFLWRVMPQGMPGLVFTLLVAAGSAGMVMAIIGANPTFAAWNMVMLPLPLLIIGVLGLFGRHGATEDEIRFSQRNPWIFRVGGVVIIVVAMKLMGIY